MSNVVFIVTGQDYGAMWSLVAANIAEDDVALEPGSGLETWQLVSVISLSVLVTALLVIKILVLCCGRKKEPTLGYLEHNHNHRLSRGSSKSTHNAALLFEN